MGTTNPGKVEEAQNLLPGSDQGLNLLTREDISFSSVEEDGLTYRANAIKKACEIGKETGFSVFSEDAGLEVDALDGRPGPFSARFAGEDSTDERNVAKLLEELDGVEDRAARFVSVGVLYLSSGRLLVRRGKLRGRIGKIPRGDSGFGYDPVFIPRGCEKTLAQLGPKIKNRISHRREVLLKIKTQIFQDL